MLESYLLLLQFFPIKTLNYSMITKDSQTLCAYCTFFRQFNVGSIRVEMNCAKDWGEIHIQWLISWSHYAEFFVTNSYTGSLLWEVWEAGEAAIQKFFNSALCCCWRGEGINVVIIGDSSELGRPQKASLDPDGFEIPFWFSYFPFFSHTSSG